jgi:hypothetical protein
MSHDRDEPATVEPIKPYSPRLAAAILNNRIDQFTNPAGRE